MKRLKKTAIKIGILLTAIIVIGLTAGKIFSESIPVGEKGRQADLLANKMLEALNADGFKALNQISFSFGGHDYQWNKAENKVEVSWDDYRIALDLEDSSKSEVYQNGESITKKQPLIDKATAYFYNDSYWLVAPFKVFDPGVERRLVRLEGGTQALLITHTSGGVTPGDSYLWLLDEQFRPIAFKMWVSIIPIGGLKATWEDYKTVNGVTFATRHRIGPVSRFIKKLESKTRKND